MHSFLRTKISVVLFTAVLFSFERSHATAEREFIMSATYGLMAGTLVGAASLAFVDKPGDNLQKVARGASLGLYVGIGLGLYTVYILPRQLEKEDQRRLEPDFIDDYYGWKPPQFLFTPWVDEKGSLSPAVVYQLTF